MMEIPATIARSACREAAGERATAVRRRSVDFATPWCESMGCESSSTERAIPGGVSLRGRGKRPSESETGTQRRRTASCCGIGTGVGRLGGPRRLADADGPRLIELPKSGAAPAELSVLPRLKGFGRFADRVDTGARDASAGAVGMTIVPALPVGGPDQLEPRFG